MRRITFWALSTLSALVLLFSYHTSTGGSSVSTSAVAPSTGGPGDDAPDSSTSDSSTSDSSAASFTGESVQTRWGPVQVEITVADGEILTAEAVEYPDHNHRDVEINSYAVPILEAETVEAQSADIDAVSGATVTSEGYVRSLQSAIDQANL